MGSILEFLKEVDDLTSDETIIQTPYSRTSALELRTWRKRLEDSFNADPHGSETRTLYTKANSVALGLEWHLSVTNEKYRTMHKYRGEAAILFKGMQSILNDYNSRKDEFEKDDVAIAEFAILINDIYKYYRRSLDFVWNRTVYDDILIEKIRNFMEEYKNGNYFRSYPSFRNPTVESTESDECVTDSDGGSNDSNDTSISEESNSSVECSTGLSDDDIH